MKFEKFLIKQAISEIRFNPLLRYHKYRIDICEKLITKLPHWTLDISKIDMYDQSDIQTSQKILNLTNKGASFLFKNVGLFENFKSLSSYLLKVIISELELSELVRFGIRYHFLSQCDAPFDELKKKMIEIFYDGKFIDEFKSERKISDLACVLDFNKKPKMFHMIFGPVTKKEISERFGEKAEEGSEASVLLDLDCYLEKPSLTAVDKFHKESYVDSQAIFEEIIGYIIY